MLHLLMLTSLQVSLLAPEDKQILPRPIKLAALKRLSVKENACTLCFDNLASIQLLPCNHKYSGHYNQTNNNYSTHFRGFCDSCSAQLNVCPMCRSSIESIQTVIPSHSKDNLHQTTKSKPLPTPQNAQINQTQDTPCPTNQLQTSLSQPTNLSGSPPEPPSHILSASSQPTHVSTNNSQNATQNHNTPTKPGQLSMHPSNPKPSTTNHHSPTQTQEPFPAEISN